MPPRPREDWIALCKAMEQGDRAALLKITSVITGYLARYGAYQFRESWDDLCQEVLIALIQSVRKRTLREPAAFVKFTGTITRNKLTDWVRQSQKPGAADPLGDPEAATAFRALVTDEAPPGPDALIDLQNAVRALPAKVRSVVELVYLQGHSYEEAARRLEIPLGTLKHLQTQGLRELRSTMEVQPAPS